jgi:hypothetical protein
LAKKEKISGVTKGFPQQKLIVFCVTEEEPLGKKREDFWCD